MHRAPVCGLLCESLQPPPQKAALWYYSNNLRGRKHPLPTGRPNSRTRRQALRRARRRGNGRRAGAIHLALPLSPAPLRIGRLWQGGDMTQADNAERDRAKAVRNARIQLLATTLNNVALAFVIGGFVAPAVSGQLRPNWSGLSTLAWIALGIGLHFAARAVLGRLKA